MRQPGTLPALCAGRVVRLIDSYDENAVRTETYGDFRVVNGTVLLPFRVRTNRPNDVLEIQVQSIELNVDLPAQVWERPD